MSGFAQDAENFAKGLHKILSQLGEVVYFTDNTHIDRFYEATILNYRNKKDGSLCRFSFGTNGMVMGATVYYTDGIVTANVSYQDYTMGEFIDWFMDKFWFGVIERDFEKANNHLGLHTLEPEQRKALGADFVEVTPAGVTTIFLEK